MNDWWGINENIAPLEIAGRAAVMFVLALVLIRLSGMRPFGKGNAFDTIIVFLIGGILSRGVVGATPFFSALIGAVTIVIIHKVLSKVSFFQKRAETAIKGTSYLLYKDGKFLKRNMLKASITEGDIYEDLRLKLHTKRLDNILEIHLEKTGEISFIQKD